MKHRIANKAVLGCATLMLSACGSIGVNLWPFGSEQERDLSRAPPGATAYRCENSKHFFVRYLDNGAAAWVILPGREFRLNKTTSASGTRYSNGSAGLDIKDNVVTLADGAGASHAGCKAVTD